MGGLVTLAVVIGLLVIVGIPYALIAISGLKSQITRLEKEIYALSRRLGQAEAKTPALPKAEGSAQVADPRETSEADPAASDTRDQEARSKPLASKAPKLRTQAARSEEATFMQSGPPKAFVFEAGKLDAFSAWLRDNWVLAVAATSLAFAGVFMVQYGIEHGVLTPLWRVMSALGFGTALIVAGEGMRRRFGDDDDTATRHLPSTLSGAGVITLFAGVLSAHLLYGLIGTNTALIGLCAVSLFAMMLGWFYGPALAAIGVIGAMAAPFALSTGSGAPGILYYYFALVTLMALGIDTIKRWAWVSVLGLVLGFAALWMLYLDDTGALHFLGAVLLVTFGAITIPQRTLFPMQGGAALTDVLASRTQRTASRRLLPEFPTRLSAGTVIVASVAAFIVAFGAVSVAEAWLGLGALILLAGGAALWLARAPALYDHMLPPATGFIALLAAMAAERGPLFLELLKGLRQSSEVNPPQTGYILYTLLGCGAFLSLLAFWRMRAIAAVEDTASRSTKPLIWSFAAATLAPSSFLILEFLWPAKRVIGDYGWALCAMALAAFMTLLAERTMKAGGPRVRLRAGLIALGALTLMAMALFLVLTKTALSLALAAMVLGIVALGRRVDLPALGWFAQLGLAVITYRLIVDPGLMWALDDAGVIDLFVAYGGVLLLLGAAWLLLDGTEQLSTRLAIEASGTLVLLTGILVALLRSFEDELASHWGFGLLAVLWGAALLAQFYRLRGTKRKWHRGLRYMLMALFGGLSALMLVMQATLANPLWGFLGHERVVGPPILDSLALAYLPVAALFAFAAWKFAKRGGLFQKGLVALASLYGVTYVAFEIRRVVRGTDLSVPGVTDIELYAYTVAMLIGAGLVLWVAFSRRSVLLRKVAMGLVAVTIAKVFLIDMSGLSGLTRVFSFMGLGLSLLGLTWAGRLMNAQWEKGEAEEAASE